MISTLRTIRKASAPCLWAAAILGIMLSSPAFASIAISGSLVEASASNGNDFSGPQISSSIVTAFVSGSSSTVSAVYSTLDDSATLSATFTQTRSGTYNSYSVGTAMIYFAPSIELPYQINGDFDFLDSLGSTYFYSELYDLTDNLSVFRNNQQGFGPANYSLGNEAGNDYNELVGSLAGTLLAGHEYYWLVQGAEYGLPKRG